MIPKMKGLSSFILMLFQTYMNLSRAGPFFCGTVFVHMMKVNGVQNNPIGPHCLDKKQ